MAEIEWIEIPAGDYVTGLTDEQKRRIREQLWIDYGIDNFTRQDRAVLESLIAKYRQLGQKGSKSPVEFTAEERKLLPSPSGDARNAYFQAEMVIEKLPSAESIYLPTFFIARYPVTYAHLNDFVASGKAPLSLSHFRHDRPPSGTEMNAAATIQTDVAQAFAAWTGCRIPTIYEWEKAARGTDGRLYPWGNEWDDRNGNFSIAYSTPVNRYGNGVSPFGVWDMCGNVSEWVIDPHHQQSDARIVKGLGHRSLYKPIWFWSMISIRYSQFAHVGLRLVRS